MPPGQLGPRGWQRLTSTFPDRAIISPVIGICEFGAGIGYEGTRQPTAIRPNLASAMIDPAQVTSDIENELSKNRLQLFSETRSLPPHYFASPLGLTDKADDSKRRIHHLSYAATGSTSINSGIPDSHGTIAYSSITDAVAAVQRWGKDCILVK